MALIGTIRKNSWILIVLLGVALAAFIVMDISGSQNMGGGDQFNMGSVNGKEIDYREYQTTEQVLYSGSQNDIYNTREFLWNYFIEKELLNEEASALGLTVSKDELLDLEFGNRLSPVIRQRFMNPQTGQVDRVQLNNIKQGIESGSLPANIRPFWAYQEKEIIKLRLQTKLTGLVAQGMYIPTWYVEQQNDWKAQTAELAYVKVPFAEVQDGEVSVSNEEIKAYLEKHADIYRNDEETRVGEYLSLEVKATSEDSAAIFDALEAKKSAFAEARNDSLYAVNNGGVYINIYATEKEMPAGIPDTVFNMPVGAMYGPYQNGVNYEVVKVVGKMTVPDSVHARHIIRMASPQQPDAVAQATQLLDSLKNLLINGEANFDSLALQYGQDGTRTKGGDLGTFSRTQMIPQFSYRVFYEGDVGDYMVFQTSQGVHLVEILDKVYETNSTGVQLAIIRSPIIPSEKTQNEVYDFALELVSQNRTLSELEKALTEYPGSKELQKTGPLTVNSYVINDLNDSDLSRSIVKWLYESGTEVGEVSSDIFVKGHPTLYYNSALLIVGLKSVIPAGLPTVEAARDIIVPILKKEKKGEMLKERLASMDMNAVASQYATEIDTVKQVTLASNSAPGLGNEPDLIAEAFTLDQGSVSEPIVGNNGVYMVKLLSKNTLTTPGNIPALRKTITQRLQGTVGQGLMNSMKENAEIVDYRSKFF